MIKVFEENPGIEIFATALLEKTIELLQENLYTEEESGADAVADDIEVLAEELDMIVENPGLKSILKQIKLDVNNRTLLE